MRQRAGWWIVAAVCVGLVSSGARADTGAQGPTAGSPEFERIKALAGRWEGTSAMDGGNEQPAVVEYRVTSGGSIVAETLFPGTEHEMLSVYHDRGGKLAMTHYCMLSNQPEMDLTESRPDHLTLSLSDRSHLDAAKDLHMHALTIAFVDDNHLTETWSSFEGGKPKGSSVFHFSRASAKLAGAPTTVANR